MPVDQDHFAAQSRSGDIACLSPEELGNRSLRSAMALIHDKKIRLCHELELIADSLPRSADKLECLAVASTLLPTLRRAHAFEEGTIYPLYEALSRAAGQSGSTDRLRAEHIEDECFAADLTEILLKVGHGGKVPDAETFGFMLRGLFDGLRRHIAFENEHIAPLIPATVVTSPSAI